MKPFEGIRVLDFTQFTSGPVCTYIFADLGAEVIKIENPPYGDNNHYTAPSKNKQTSYITSLNHNKKCILMNMKDPRQVELFFKMVKTADLVIDNFKAGTLEKFGVSFEKLQAVNPAIVWTSIAGYGQHGPWARRTAYDSTIQGIAGLMSVTGEKGGRPLKAGLSMSDLTAGLYACCGTAAAVFDAKRTGKGRRIDLAMVDSTYAFLQEQAGYFLNTGNVLPRMGREHPYYAPYGSFRCKDGQERMICVRTNEEFLNLCTVLNLPEAAVDPRFAASATRAANREALNELVGKAAENFTAEALETALENKGVPCAKIQTIPEAMASGQIAARKMVIPVSYDDGTASVIPNTPIQLSRMERPEKAFSHKMGQDTIAFLSQFADEAYIHEIYDPILADSEEKWAAKAARLQ